jgi:bacterioferritin-associated ferredoxin
LQLDDPVCYCFHISKRKVLNFIRIHEPKRASQISECGGAGSGCGWCIPFLKKYFAMHAQGDLEFQDEIIAADYARQRGAYLSSGKGVAAEGAIAAPKDDSN